MKFPPDIPVYGDRSFRGYCALEVEEQVTFFAELRRRYPETLGKIAVHIRNEGKRSHVQAAMYKAEGLTPGASDIMIPGSPTFLCELKRMDHTKCKLTDDERKYLLLARDRGAFVCVALGFEAALCAIEDWLLHHPIAP